MKDRRPTQEKHHEIRRDQSDKRGEGDRGGARGRFRIADEVKIAITGNDVGLTVYKDFKN